jgi:hypothetical protein
MLAAGAAVVGSDPAALELLGAVLAVAGAAALAGW